MGDEKRRECKVGERWGRRGGEEGFGVRGIEKNG